MAMVRAATQGHGGNEWLSSSDVTGASETASQCVSGPLPTEYCEHT